MDSYLPDQGLNQCSLPLALEAWSLNHWTTREVLFFFFFFLVKKILCTHVLSIPVPNPNPRQLLICFSVSVVLKLSLSHVWLFVTPWAIAHQAPLPMGFSRQEYWSGYHFLLQGILQTQGSNPSLLCLPHWQGDSLPLSHLGGTSVTLDYFK